MHKHDEHVEGCEQYVAAGPLVSRSTASYRASQKMIGVVSGLPATMYFWGDHDNMLFYGERAEERARIHQDCTGAKDGRETRPDGTVRHVVRFGH